jgi:hypothetical protein
MILLIAITVSLGLLFWLCQRLPHIAYVAPLGGRRTAPDNDYGDVYLTNDFDVDDVSRESDDYQDSTPSASDRNE